MENLEELALEKEQEKQIPGSKGFWLSIASRLTLSYSFGFKAFIEESSPIEISQDISVALDEIYQTFQKNQKVYILERGNYKSYINLPT